jgi:tetratricopeptide (TPR) repeat protein
MAAGYGSLGILAHARGDYDEAARRYQRSLDIRERTGDQDGMATTYSNLGLLAQVRGDYEAAADRHSCPMEARPPYAPAKETEAAGLRC